MNYHIYDQNKHCSLQKNNFSNFDIMYVKNLKDTKIASDLEIFHTVLESTINSSDSMISSSKSSEAFCLSKITLDGALALHYFLELT